MNNLAALLVIAMVALTPASMAAAYSIEATLTYNKNNGQYEVAARISRLVDQGGNITEEVIARPRIVSTPGVPGSFYVGADQSDKSYRDEENVSMEVFWPKKRKHRFATCTITVRRGDVIVSKTGMKVQVVRK